MRFVRTFSVKRHPFSIVTLFAVAGLVWVQVASAQRTQQQVPQLEGVGVDEKLGQTIPMDISFLDSNGNPVEVGQYFNQGKPVLLSMVYHNCPMLCGLLLQGLTASLKDVGMAPGDEFELLTVSIGRDEKPALAAEKKQQYLTQYGDTTAAGGWHFLTGEVASIDRLAGAVGFKYRYIEDKNQYAHPPVIMFLSPEGKITRYIYGIEFQPKDVRKALVEASNGKVGTPLDQFYFYCFQYDPDANSYVPVASSIMKVGGSMVLVLLMTALFIFWRKESKNQKDASGWSDEQYPEIIES